MSTGWYAYPPGNKSICHLWRIWKSSTPKCRLEGDIGKVPRTLPKTNIEPENRQRAPKGKLVVQPSIFRCENVSFMEGISLVCTVCLAIAEVNWIPNYVSWVSLCILQGMTIAPWHQKRESRKKWTWYQVIPGLGKGGCFQMCWRNSGGGAWKLEIYSSWDWDSCNWTVQNQWTLNIIKNR